MRLRNTKSLDEGPRRSPRALSSSTAPAMVKGKKRRRDRQEAVEKWTVSGDAPPLRKRTRRGAVRATAQQREEEECHDSKGYNTRTQGQYTSIQGVDEASGASEEEQACLDLALALQMQEEEFGELLQPEVDARDDEDETVTWLTSHLLPDIVIWSSDEQEKAVHAAGRFEVGWKLREDEEEASGTPDDYGSAETDRDDGTGTMFIVRKAQGSAPGQTEHWTRELNAAAALLQKLRPLPGEQRGKCRLLIIAGAGIGCDSQLPDYRSPSGFWRDYAPLKEAGVSLKELSKSSLFHLDPTLAWGFYTHRQNLYGCADPHRGFRVLWQLCELADKGRGGHSLRSGKDTDRGGWFVFTSNVDSQFQKAGFDEERVCESHGSLRFLQCLNRCERQVWLDDEYQACIDKSPSLESDEQRELFASRRPLDDKFRIPQEALPSCFFGCGSIARPNVSFFSDTTETYVNSRTADQKERLQAWIGDVQRSGDELLVVEVGCGTSIHSLRIESEVLLYHYPGMEDRVSLVRINPSSPGVESKEGRVGLGMGAEASLLELAKRMSMS